MIETKPLVRHNQQIATTRHEQVIHIVNVFYQVWLMLNDVAADDVVEGLRDGRQISTRFNKINVRYVARIVSDLLCSGDQPAPVKYIEIPDIWPLLERCVERTDFQHPAVI